jgi:hypothetical protein
MLGKQDGVWRLTEIRLLPVVTILDEENHDRVISLLEKVEKSCLIARSLTPVHNCPLPHCKGRRDELSVPTRS